MNQIIAEKLALIAENEQKVYEKGKTDGTAEGYQSGYTEGYTAGYAEGEASGGGGSDFPVEEFFAKTVEELDLTGITNLGAYSVFGQNELKKIHIPDVETIAMMAIGSCAKLEELTFPASLKSLAMTTVTSCANLKTVTFEGKPESISTMAFSGCSNVTTINVSWQPDEVAGKPWGLPSAAVINYGYTKED